MMDDEEKQILKEANALRRRELDLRQVRIDKTFAIGRLAVLLWMALATVTLGVIGLAQLDLPWDRAVFFTSACASITSFFAFTISSGERSRNATTWGVLFIVCAFVAALTCPEAGW